MVSHIRLLICCIVAASRFLGHCGEPAQITGAFGLTFGDVIKPESGTEGGSLKYASDSPPPVPSPNFINYSIRTTVSTHQVYCIEASSPETKHPSFTAKENFEQVKFKAEQIVKVLEEKYGKVFPKVTGFLDPIAEWTVVQPDAKITLRIVQWPANKGAHLEIQYLCLKLEKTASSEALALSKEKAKAGL